MLLAYAAAASRHHGGGVADLLHQGEHGRQAQEHLRRLVADLIVQAPRESGFRDGVGPLELAAYCLHAVTAAGAFGPRPEAADRLVEVTLAGLRCP